MSREKNIPGCATLGPAAARTLTGALSKLSADEQVLVVRRYFDDESWSELESATVVFSEVPRGLEDCVRAAVKRWKYPALNDRDVKLPFVFPVATPED